jgi:hypothetical protein
MKNVFFLFTTRTICVLLVSSNFFQIFEVQLTKIILPLSIFKNASLMLKIWCSQQWVHFVHTQLRHNPPQFQWNHVKTKCEKCRHCSELDNLTRNHPFFKIKIGKIIFATSTLKIWKKFDDASNTDRELVV